MSYETVIDQIKSLPESSLEEVSRYIEFLLYQQEQVDMAPLIELDEVFEERCNAVMPMLSKVEENRWKKFSPI